MSEMRVCHICRQAYPATSEYFYKTGKYLRKICKKCYIKRVIVSNRCKTCQRYDKRSDKCMVMIKPFEDCWAWTDDKNWEKKVHKDVIKYTKTKRLINGGVADVNS